MLMLVAAVICIAMPVKSIESPADFNHDGVVDGKDLAFFSREYGKVLFCSAKFAWDANTEKNLAGYKIHYGTKPRQYDKVVDIPDKSAVTGVVTKLEPGVTYYFAATAYDTDGFESDYSDEIVWTAKGDNKK